MSQAVNSLSVDLAARCRVNFPQLQVKVHNQPLLYLDSAATTLKPTPVIQALEQYYRQEVANVHRGAHWLSDQGTFKYEEARTKVQKFINAKSPNEIIFTKGTTEGLNLLARSYAGHFLQKGDEILLTEMEHHSNIVPWQLVAEEKGLKIQVVPINERGELIWGEFTKSLNKKTKLVSFVSCSNALGTLNPVAEMIAEVKRVCEAVTVVDAAQSVSARPTDVQSWDCDFMVFSGHKIFGPTGIGVLYGREDLLNKMPPYQGGGSMISQVSFTKTSYLPAPQRFEAGTPHIAGAIGLAAALDYVQQLGFGVIQQHEEALLTEAEIKLSQIPGLKWIGQPQQRLNILSFLIEGIHPSDIGQVLDQMGVAVRTGHHCCQPIMDYFKIPGTVRASFSVYNSVEDVDRLYQALLKARGLFL